MVTYQTPKFAGLQATVQYSFNEDSVKETAREASSAVNRYSSAALTGDFGALQTVLAYEFQNYKSFGAAAEHDDGQIVYLGGNYKVGNNAYVYADVERSAGGDIDVDWRANIGARFVF